MIDFETFLDHYRHFKQASPQTIKAYSSDLIKFRTFLEEVGVGRITQVNPKVIKKYITFMEESASGRSGKKGLSQATIARRLAAVSSFFDYVRTTRFHNLMNPVAAFTKRWKRNNKPKPVDRDAVEKLLAAVNSDRDRVLIMLFLATGLRLSEMEQLERTTIAVERRRDKQGNPTVVGVGEVLGKGNKVRSFYVTAKVMVPLFRYVKERKDDHPALFVSERKKGMSARAMQERLAYWCKEAGLDHINIHRLRHTFATWVANTDKMDIVSLKELLGHASLVTTMQYVKMADTTVARGYHAAMEWVDI